MLNYHRFLFQWHCRKFFRYRRHLSIAEKEYLEVCFSLAENFREVSESGYERYSYYSYSHRVEGDQVNSTRLAYGSVAHPEQAWQAASRVVAERGISVPRFYLENPLCKFYGLGWDIQERQFKLYFRVSHLQHLPAELVGLLHGYDLAEHRDEGLVSYTYTDNLLEESKIYLYPKSPPELPAGALGQAHMLTDRRGNVAQYDVDDPQAWADRLSEPGKKIIALYHELEESLDTITYQDRSHYTLYFP